VLTNTLGERGKAPLEPNKPLAQVDLLPVLDAMREGFQILDSDYRYVYLNDAAALHGRASKASLLGRRITECYPGIEHTEVFTLMGRCLRERCSTSLRNEFEYPDKTKRTFELRIEPCNLGVVVLSLDVTDGLRVEEQLRHAQKMEAIGRLAGSVAHDFNNLLSVILSSSEMLLEDLKPMDPIRTDIEGIKRAGERAADLTRQLLAFSRQQLLCPRVLDLNAVVQEAERMLRRLLGEDIDLVTHYQRGISRIKADAGQIDQVVMNLAINARDAMPNGGKLTIEIADVTLDQAYAAEHFGLVPGPYVMLALSDTGIGMDRETQLRIFEPFFSTKPPGKGTGLGLSTVFGIVQQSGGHVWVYSEPGKGTTFRVYLPRAKDLTPPPPPPAAPLSLDGSETILLVEDQEEVRQVALQILRRHGYHVIEARNAGEALLTCERHPRAIQLLLTDVVMPQMNGRELAERLRTLRPELRVVFMSGYTENAVVTHGILDSGATYLQKPIVPEALARCVRTALDAPLHSRL
jgi:two-component system, cell cycle sensor histidine kinase and response regulator CckA